MEAGGMREADRTFVVMAGFLALILGAYAVIADRVAPSPETILEHLASTPLHRSFYGAAINAPLDPGGDDENPHVLGVVRGAGTLKTAQAEGGAALLAYYVFDSADAAQDWFDEILAHTTEPARDFKLLNVSILFPHTCAFTSEHFCYVLVGPVVIEATSRITLFGVDDQPRLRELVQVALDHLKDAQPNGLGL
jgi:hypothetical protein